jgi:hypothetical protein
VLSSRELLRRVESPRGADKKTWLAVGMVWMVEKGLVTEGPGGRVITGQEFMERVLPCVLKLARSYVETDSRKMLRWFKEHPEQWQGDEMAAQVVTALERFRQAERERVKAFHAWVKGGKISGGKKKRR